MFSIIIASYAAIPKSSDPLSFGCNPSMTKKLEGSVPIADLKSIIEIQ